MGPARRLLGREPWTPGCLREGTMQTRVAYGDTGLWARRSRRQHDRHPGATARLRGDDRAVVGNVEPRGRRPRRRLRASACPIPEPSGVLGSRRGERSQADAPGSAAIGASAQSPRRDGPCPRSITTEIRVGAGAGDRGSTVGTWREAVQGTRQRCPSDVARALLRPRGRARRGDPTTARRTSEGGTPSRQ